MARKPRKVSKDTIKAKADKAAKRSAGEEIAEPVAPIDPPVVKAAALVKLGRPTKYTRKIADKICAAMAEGRTLNSICREPGMPARTTVLLWKDTDKDGFSDRYARARESLIDYWTDDLLDIADDSRNDYVIVDGAAVLNHEAIARAKLRVDTRKWMLSKLMPRIYGDRTTVDMTVTEVAAEMTDADLERIAFGSGAGAIAPPKGSQKPH